MFAVQLAVYIALLSSCNHDNAETRVYADLQAGTLARVHMPGGDSASKALPTALSLQLEASQ